MRVELFRKLHDRDPAVVVIVERLELLCEQQRAVVLRLHVPFWQREIVHDALGDVALHDLEHLVVVVHALLELPGHVLLHRDRAVVIDAAEERTRIRRHLWVGKREMGGKAAGGDICICM